MIDQTDSVLQEWIKSVVGSVEVILGSPVLLDGKRGVCLYLLALAESPATWIKRQLPRRVALRYLITAWAEDEKEAHSFLGKLLVAAMEKQEYEIDLTEVPATLWTAFGIAPRPAFMLYVPFSVEKPAPTPKLVQGPLVVHGSPIRSLHGIVLGPGDIPVVGAAVELPALQLRGHTDVRGRFRFAAVPSEPLDLQLIVRARGQIQNVTVDHAFSDTDPLEIRFISFDAR